jgi:hypothetical protein
LSNILIIAERDCLCTQASKQASSVYQSKQASTGLNIKQAGDWTSSMALACLWTPLEL